MAHLLGHFHGMHLDEISSASLSDFERLRAKAVQRPTIRRDLACLSSIFTSAEEWEWTDKNPVNAFLRARKKRGLVENPPRERYLSHDEEKAVLAQCNDAWRARITFAVDEGFRKTEQFSAGWKHLSFQSPMSLGRITGAGEARIPRETTKNGKPRAVPLLERTHDLLKFAERRSLMVFPTGDGAGFSVKSTSTIWEGFKKITRRAGVEDLTWHDLRRTCGCHLLQDYRFQMHEVRDWMGHSPVKVTERHYAFLRVDDLHRAVAKGRENVVGLGLRGAR